MTCRFQGALSDRFRGRFCGGVKGRNKCSRTILLHLPAQVPIDMPLVTCHPPKIIRLNGAPDFGRVTGDREVEGWRARPVGSGLLKNLLTGPNNETSSPTVHTSLGQKLNVVLTDRLCCDRRRPDAEEL